MKPAPFRYECPETVDEALALLTQHGDDAKVLAGGQSLLPLLNMRLARPGVLIDINRLAELGSLTRTGNALRIGALTRQVSLERSPLVAARFPLLAQAAGWVAHPQIRTRGTVGGSSAHADGSAELPATFCAMNATFRCRSAVGERVVPWREFFLGQYESALRPDELLTGIDVPEPPAGTGAGFAEHARRRGDFAIAGAAALIRTDPSGRCEQVAISIFGVASTPLRLTSLEQELIGQDARRFAEPPGAPALQALTTEAAMQLRPGADLHGDQLFRQEIAAVVLARALSAAVDDVTTGRQEKR